MFGFSLISVDQEEVIMLVRNFFTKRNRVLTSVSLVVLAVIIICCISGINRSASASTHNVKYYKCITIEKNQTLWSVAKENISEEYDSIDDYIKEIKYINGFSEDTLYVGASIVIPYYDAPM